MNTCDTCKHWLHSATDGEMANVRLCNQPKLFMVEPTSMTFDGQPRRMVTVIDESEIGEDEAGMYGDSGVPIELFTGPKFGCVHWEETK